MVPMLVLVHRFDSCYALSFFDNINFDNNKWLVVDESDGEDDGSEEHVPNLMAPFYGDHQLQVGFDNDSQFDILKN